MSTDLPDRPSFPSPSPYPDAASHLTERGTFTRAEMEQEGNR